MQTPKMQKQSILRQNNRMRERGKGALNLKEPQNASCSKNLKCKQKLYKTQLQQKYNNAVTDPKKKKCVHEL